MEDEVTTVERPLTQVQQDFARALARAVLFVPRAFDADLGRHVGMSTSEYFALMHLSEAAGHRLRMGELARCTGLSLSATTRVVGLLEREGLVERQRSVLDGRGQDAVLTPGGRARLEQARPRQLATMRKRIFDRLDGVDLEQCTAALTRISQDG